MAKDCELDVYERRRFREAYGKITIQCGRCATLIVGVPCRKDYLLFKCDCGGKAFRETFVETKKRHSVSFTERRLEKIELYESINKARRGTDKCYVYFICCGDTSYVKIGVARNIKNRIKALQAANPLELKIIGSILCPDMATAFETEIRLHQKYKENRRRGEWFLIQGKLDEIPEKQELKSMLSIRPDFKKTVKLKMVL